MLRHKSINEKELSYLIDESYHRSICDRHFLIPTLAISQIRIEWVTERWHLRSILIIIIGVTLGWICIGIGIDKPVHNIYHAIDYFFTLDERLVCGSLINAWKDVAKSCFCMGIFYPFIHGHTSVGNCTEKGKR